MYYTIANIIDNQGIRPIKYYTYLSGKNANHLMWWEISSVVSHIIK